MGRVVPGLGLDFLKLFQYLYLGLGYELTKWAGVNDDRKGQTLLIHSGCLNK